MLRIQGFLRTSGPHAPDTVRRRLATWSTLTKWRGVSDAFASPALPCPALPCPEGGDPTCDPSNTASEETEERQGNHR
jgi:hypothetical protein